MSFIYSLRLVCEPGPSSQRADVSADREADGKHSLRGKDKERTQWVLDAAFLFEIFKGKYHSWLSCQHAEDFPDFDQ